MELDNVENKKPVSVYYFNKLKKMKFEKFQIYLGFDKHTQYYINDFTNHIYEKIVKIKDYEKFGLIDSKTIDIKELLVDTKWESLEQLIKEKSNSKELFNEIEELVRLYLMENINSNEKGSFELVDFSFIYLIDGEKKEVIDYDEKRRKTLVNILVYSSLFFIVSGLILFFIDNVVGTIVMLIPLMFYLIYVFYNVLIDLRNELKYRSEGKNVFLFYLMELPYKIVFYTFYLILMLGWYIIPGYLILHFFNNSSSNYDPLDIIGFFWFWVYIFVMTSIGSKLLKYIGSIENKIKSYF